MVKRILIIMFLMTLNLFGQNKKITELPAATLVDSVDVFVFVDVGQDTTKKVTYHDLLQVPAGGLNLFSWDASNDLVWRPYSSIPPYAVGGVGTMVQRTNLGRINSTSGAFTNHLYVGDVQDFKIDSLGWLIEFAGYDVDTPTTAHTVFTWNGTKFVWDVDSTGGGGDAYLANNQTFTGNNTFSNGTQTDDSLRVNAILDVNSYIDLDHSGAPNAINVTHTYNPPGGVNVAVLINKAGTSSGASSMVSLLVQNTAVNSGGASYGVDVAMSATASSRYGIRSIISGTGNNWNWFQASGGTNNYSGYFSSGTTWFDNELELDIRSGDPGTLTNTAFVYAKDVAASAEVFVMDEGGTPSQISRHSQLAPDWMYDYEEGVPDEVFYEYNVFTGMVRFTNKTRRDRIYENQLLGKPIPTDTLKIKYRHIETFAEFNSRTGGNLVMQDWDERQEISIAKRDLIVDAWEHEEKQYQKELKEYNKLSEKEKAKKTKPSFHIEKPKRYTKKEKPKFLKIFLGEQ